MGRRISIERRGTEKRDTEKGGEREREGERQNPCVDWLPNGYTIREFVEGRKEWRGSFGV